MSCKIVRDMEMNICPHCAGAFVLGRDIESAFGIQMVVKRILHCSKCNTLMSTKIINGIEVDICPSCGMVWLDKSELAKLWISKPMQKTVQARK